MTRPRALAALLAAALLGGCGATHRSPSRSTPANTDTVPTVPATIVSPQLISDADVAATKPGSPAHAALAWFQALQFQDLQSLRTLTTAPALRGMSDAQLQSMLGLVGPAVGRPKITAVLNTPTGRSVRMLLLYYQGRRAVQATPYTLSVERAGNSWLVSDIGLLQRIAAAITGRSQKQP
jgi:hypothetical protein